MKFSYLIIIALVLNLLSPGMVSATNYSDVSVNYKHSEAISALTNQGIVKGYANNQFHPGGLINRAEVVKVLVETQFNDSVINQALDWHKKWNHWYIRFPDVKMSDWFGKYVETAYQNQIIQGYPDGTFKPANNINYAEALKIIFESYDINPRSVYYQPNKLLYVKRGEWFEPYFTYAYEHNLINQNKFYHPAQLITRGEFVEIIYRLQTIIKTGLPEFVVNRSPTSNDYKITIPKLNIIDLQVSFADPYNENIALAVLSRGLGHYLSPPSAGKKIIIFGHSSGYSWDNSNYKTILRQINKLNNGDRIYINYKEKGYVYEIFKSDIIPATEDYRLTQNRNQNELALYTCWPPDQISHRYVVYGRPVS